MFTETTLCPPAWKIQWLFIAGAACAAYIIVLCVLAINGTTINNKQAGLMLVAGVFMWICWSRARTLAGSSLGIRKSGIEIKRRAAELEPLFIGWKEIERIEATAFQASYASGGRGTGVSTIVTRYIGIRLVDESPMRQTKGHEKNRRYSGCDILLAANYGMSIEETVALLRKKMSEAIGSCPPVSAKARLPDLVAKP